MEKRTRGTLPSGVGALIGLFVGMGFGLVFAPLLDWNVGLAVAVGAGFGLIFGGALDMTATRRKE